MRHLAAAAYLERDAGRRRRDRRGAGVALHRRLHGGARRRRRRRASAAGARAARSRRRAGRVAGRARPRRSATSPRPPSSATTPLAEAGLLDRAGQMAMRAAAQDDGRGAAPSARIALYEAAGEHGAAARVLDRPVAHRPGAGPARRGARADAATPTTCCATSRRTRASRMLTTRLAGAVLLLRRRRRAAPSWSSRRSTSPRRAACRGAHQRGHDQGDGGRVRRAIRRRPRGLFQLSLDLAQKHELREEASRACLEPVRPRLPARPLRRGARPPGAGDRAGARRRQPAARVVRAQRVDVPALHARPLGRGDGRVSTSCPRRCCRRGGTLLSPLQLDPRDPRVPRRRSTRRGGCSGSTPAWRTRSTSRSGPGYAAANACVLHAEGRYAEAVAAGETTIDARRDAGLDGQDAKMGFMWAIEAALALGDRDEGGGADRPDRGDPAGACGRRRSVPTPAARAPAWPSPPSAARRTWCGRRSRVPRSRPALLARGDACSSTPSVLIAAAAATRPSRCSPRRARSSRSCGHGRGSSAPTPPPSAASAEAVG